MSKAGRKPLSMPRFERKIYLDADSLIQVEKLLMDPLREKIAYGALSDLINLLLRTHLETLKSLRPQNTGVMTSAPSKRDEG